MAKNLFEAVTLDYLKAHDGEYFVAEHYKHNCLPLTSRKITQVLKSLEEQGLIEIHDRHVSVK